MVHYTISKDSLKLIYSRVFLLMNIDGRFKFLGFINYFELLLVLLHSYYVFFIIIISTVYTHVNFYDNLFQYLMPCF